MRLATIRLGCTETDGIVTKEGILPIRALNVARGMEPLINPVIDLKK